MRLPVSGWSGQEDRLQTRDRMSQLHLPRQHPVAKHQFLYRFGSLLFISKLLTYLVNAARICYILYDRGSTRRVPRKLRDLIIDVILQLLLFPLENLNLR